MIHMFEVNGVISVVGKYNINFGIDTLSEHVLVLL
jgi:hypothetical protein